MIFSFKTRQFLCLPLESVRFTNEAPVSDEHDILINHLSSNFISFPY